MATNAVKTALAYVYATGSFPRGIQLATWSASFALCEKAGMSYGLKPEALAVIEGHPLKLAHDYMIKAGFTVDRGRAYRNTSHYVAYRNPNGDEASAYRGGSGSIRRKLHSDKPPFWRLEHITPAEIAAALKPVSE